MLKLLKSADYVTILNAIVGSTAILLVLLNHEYKIASLLIFLCIALDYVDGYVARKAKKQNLFGSHIDAFSDVFSFGFLPALLVISYFTNFSIISLIGFIAMIVANILRHSRLLIILETEKIEKTGLANPVVSVVIALSVLSGFEFPRYFWEIMLLIFSYLMISSIKYPTHRAMGKKNLMTFAMVVVAALMISILFSGVELFFIFTMLASFGYVFIAPIIKAMKK